MRTVVLTSTENFVWTSMQEIIPSIEEAWRRSATAKHSVRIVDVGVESIGSYLADVVEADHIVFTCFTVKLARVGEFLRKQANVEGRYVIYLHNQATIACWPLFAWGIGETLKTDDVFVSSSAFDARTLKLTFPRGRVAIHPFWLPGKLDRMRKKKAADPINFVFAGRVSSQKNLHALVEAFAIHARKNSTSRLVIFGGEDGLGSPNMGLKDVGYREQVETLAKRSGVGDRVEFPGALERKVLHRKLKDPHVFVSASLHSDENFGMSALRSLCMGAPAVLSRWGGHADFKHEFDSRLELVPVERSKNGPWIDPEVFARAMTRAARKLEAKARPRSHIPRRYRVESMASLIRELVRRPRPKSSGRLEPTAFARGILRGREEMKIFSSYSDPKAHRFFVSYGMSSK